MRQECLPITFLNNRNIRLKNERYKYFKGGHIIYGCYDCLLQKPKRINWKVVKLGNGFRKLFGDKVNIQK